MTPTLETLERAVEEANAKVAERLVAYLPTINAGTGRVGAWDALLHANDARTAALAALEDARKPKPRLMTVGEAWRIWIDAPPRILANPVPSQEQTDGLQAVLTAAHERAYAVIEGLPEQQTREGGLKLRSIADIQRALGLS